MTEENDALTATDLAAALRVIGLTFTEAELSLMLEGVQDHRAAYAKIRDIPLPNEVPPALVFMPSLANAGEPLDVPPSAAPVRLPKLKAVEDLAFAPVTELAARIRDRQVTSVALTEMYLERLRRYDPLLHCVVTLTEERALNQAQRADAEIAAGQYRGPLHGIPWGAKDLLATRGIPTTWGAAPYRHQIPQDDAGVVQRLDAAGAVLVAKLSVGELAWGDVWFGETTRNPWNPEEGASGSSAGSAAAVAAGLVGFALGTETWGSIVSPATRCGVTGLRPSFGRVSRDGAMALSWSMDKVGPLARSVDDCALIFAAIAGGAGRDGALRGAPYVPGRVRSVTGMRVGIVEAAFAEERDDKALDEAALAVLRTLGIQLVPIALPEYPVPELALIMEAEAAAAFDELTRSNRDDELVRQGKDTWPNVFRVGRLIPAVEYIQANRIRSLLVGAMDGLLADLDAYLAPSFGADNLLLTNLTGHPAVVVPSGFNDAGRPSGSLTLTGRIDGEATILALAAAYQEATGFHLRHPNMRAPS